MKKQLLFLFPVLLTAMLANAQDVTSYRGAFAPAPVHQWTEDWTNWDPKNTVYPSTNVTISADITANTTWTSNNVYKLSGTIHVVDGVTLTIEPGTIIRGDETIANSALLIARGGKLFAEGTQCKPIVFTSNKAPLQRSGGDWGGLILLGKAKNNKGGSIVIEGLATADPNNYHGGADNSDNSGTLKYVRIEFPGYVFSPNNEINGLTFGSVGNGTIVDYVQVSFSNDDSYEWFGGAVNCKHIVAYRGLDDDFDTDNGFSGIVQYVLGVKDPNISDVPSGCGFPSCSSSEGFESDNDDPGTNESLAPKTSARFYNVTQIGAFRCGNNANASGVTPTAPNRGFIRGARLRRNTDLKIYNSILMNNWRGLLVDGALALGNMDQDSLAFRNNIIAGDFTTTWSGAAPYGGTKSIAAENDPTRTRLFNSVYGNDSVNTCSLLVNAWDFLNPDYRPNAGFTAPGYTDNPAYDFAQDGMNINNGADLSANIAIAGGSFTANQTQDFVVALGEAGSGSSSGIITVTVPKLTGWVITVPGITLSGTPQSGTNGSASVPITVPTNNGDWNFYEDAFNVYAVSKPGIVVPLFGEVILGFRATRPAATPNGTNQNLGASVSGGGDTTPGNNSSLFGFSAN